MYIAKLIKATKRLGYRRGRLNKSSSEVNRFKEQVDNFIVNDPYWDINYTEYMDPKGTKIQPTDRGGNDEDV